MGEVKAQINALETAEKPSPAPSQTPAKAQKAPEQAEPVVAIPSEAIIRPQIDPVPLEGEITEQKNSVNFYGFTMLDSGYDFGQNDRAWFDVIRPTKLPSFPNQFAPSGNVYAGVRQINRTVKVATSTGVETSATTTEIYDRQGRLYSVTEPSGDFGANTTTTYGKEESEDNQHSWRDAR